LKRGFSLFLGEPHRSHSRRKTWRSRYGRPHTSNGSGFL